MPQVKAQKRSHAVSLSSVLWGVSALAFLFLVIKNSSLAASLTFSALILCGKTLIPALFPSAVAARVLSSCGALSPFAASLEKWSRKIFGLGGEAFAVAVTGIICGFPTGAVGAQTLYEKGKINKDELLRTAVLSGTPSLSFLVFAVGERGFGDREFGFFLFFASLFSSAAVTSLSVLLRGKKKTTEKCEKNGCKDEKKTLCVSGSCPFGVRDFTAAVSSSAFDILRVCAFVIFFSVAAGLIEPLLASLHIPSGFMAILGCLEITGGMTRAAALATGGKIAAAFLSGFGGLCAAAQVGAIVSQANISIGRYLLARIAAGVICAMAFFFFF